MADISTITVNNTTYNLKDAFARPHLVYYVRGTQTASTNLWTGNLPYVDELYEGLTIAYFLPFAGTSTAAKLTLTLKDGTNTDQIPVYLSGKDTISTGQPVNSIWEYVYQTVTVSGVNYTGWFSIRAYDTNSNTTDIVNLYQGSAAYQANSAVYRYQLLFQMNENELTPLNNNSNATGTSKTMLTNVEFDPFGYVFYYNSTTAVSAGGNMTTTLYYQRNTVDLRYTFNCGQTLTAHKMFYLKLSLQSNGKVKIANATPWTHDLPNTNDGYLYMLLGRTYSTYQFELFKEHPIYYHDGTSLRQYVRPDLATSSNPGLMSAADKAKLDGIDPGSGYELPIASSSTLGGIKVGTNLSINSSSGVLSATDTKYTATTTSIGSASAGTAIKANNITSWSTGTLPTLGTAIPADDITSWSTGTLPTLGTAIPADDITSWSTGTLPTLGTAIATDDITSWSTGTLPTLGTAISADDITSWSTGTLPTLGSAIPADDITSWSTGTLPSATVQNEVLTITFGTLPALEYTAKSIPNVTGVGTLPALGYTSRSIPNVTGVGTLPALDYTARSIPNVTAVGTLPTLGYTSKSIPNVTSVGTLPTLEYTAKSIPNVTSVGTLPALSHSEKTIPNITVSTTTVVKGITAS